MHPAPGKASSFLQLCPRLSLILTGWDFLPFMPKAGPQKAKLLATEPTVEGVGQ